MPGPAPKPKEQRRNRAVPRAGEWVDLEPLTEPLLPEASQEWPGRVKRLWAGWRADPVTSQYGSADLAAIWDLAENFCDLTENSQTVRMNALGLTPKAKRDLRWRTPAEVATIRRQAASVTKLRVAG